MPTPAETEALVKSGAYFSLFSLPNPASPSTGVSLTPFTPALFVAFTVSEALHRFEVEEIPPEAQCGFRIRQAYGSADVARVNMRMTPMPNNFQPGPGRIPWPTVLLPFLSQRFTPLDGHFNFLDAATSGFSAIGAGRVVPTPGNSPRLAAVLEVQEPTGRLSGFSGMGIVNGEIAPPSGFAFNVLFRIDDPEGRLRTQQPLPPLLDPSDPTPSSTGSSGTSFLPLLSESDPDRPLRVAWTSDGRYLAVHLAERLRLVHLGFAINPHLRSETRVGALVGRHTTTLLVDLQVEAQVYPAFSREDRFDFFDAQGQTLGSLTTRTIEARLIPQEQAGGLVEFGGFAEPISGTGQFQNPLGMVSLNGAFDPRTGAVSALYMLRLTANDAIFKSLSDRRPRGETR